MARLVLLVLLVLSVVGRWCADPADPGSVQIPAPFSPFNASGVPKAFVGVGTVVVVLLRSALLVLRAPHHCR